MKNITQFYKILKSNFPKINQCKFWDEYDWSEEGYENSFIMTEIAQEISSWDTKLEFGELTKLFNIIEIGFVEYDNSTSSFLATDFLVTIMEIKNKLIRDKIKKMMGSKTQENYRAMLKFYRENN